MKLFQRIAAAALAGVMALSMLTGCAVGDAMKENAMLTAVQTFANLYGDNIKVSEDKELSKKVSGVFSACSTKWNMENPLSLDPLMYTANVEYKGAEYDVVVTEMPKNAKDSGNWGSRAFYIFITLANFAEYDEDDINHEHGRLKLGFDVMNDAKLTGAKDEKAANYMVVIAKHPEQNS